MSMGFIAAYYLGHTMQNQMIGDKPWSKSSWPEIIIIKYYENYTTYGRVLNTALMALLLSWISPFPSLN